MNTAIFNQIIIHFSDLWNLENPGLHCYVFGDQLGSHRDKETIKICYQKNVFLWYLPSNTSHFLQPLDNLCFAILKSKFKSMFEDINLMVFLCDKNKRCELFAAMYEAESQTFTTNVIKSSFINTGLFPFRTSKKTFMSR